MILTGAKAYERLIKYRALYGRESLIGRYFGYKGSRCRFQSSYTIGAVGYYYTRINDGGSGHGIKRFDIQGIFRVNTPSLRLYTQDFPLPEDCSGAVNGSSHKPEIGENTMRNTTKKLFQIANFNLGSVVKKQGVEFLVAGFRGFYQNSRISTYSSDDVTSVPPTDNPTIEYQLLGRDGRTVVARKSDLTLVRSYYGIHEKYAVGTAVAYGSAKDDLEELKTEWTRVRPSATPAPTPAPVAAPAVAPSRSVVVTADGITATIQFDGSAEDLYEKLERLV